MSAIDKIKQRIANRQSLTPIEEVNTLTQDIQKVSKQLEGVQNFNFFGVLPEITISAPRVKIDEKLRNEVQQTQEYNEFFQGRQPYSIGKSPEELQRQQYAKDILNTLEQTAPVYSSVKGAVENIGQGIKDVQSGNALGVVAGTMKMGLGIGSVTTPSLALFTEGVKQLEPIIGKEATEYAFAPVTKITNPQTPTEKYAAEIGDIAFNMAVPIIGKKLLGLRGKTPEVTPETKVPLIPENVPQRFKTTETGTAIKEITLDQKIELGKLKLERDEIVGDRIDITNTLKEMKGKKGKEFTQKRKELIKTAKLLDDRLTEIDTKIKGIGEGEVKGIKGLLPEKVTQKQENIPTENAPSNINFAVATEPGAKTIRKVWNPLTKKWDDVLVSEEGKTAPVKRSVGDYLKDRKLDIFGVEKPKKPTPIDIYKLKETLDQAKTDGNYGEVLSELKKEAFRRFRTKEFDQALAESEKLTKVEPKAPEGQITNLLEEQQKELQNATSTQPKEPETSGLPVEQVKPVVGETKVEVKKGTTFGEGEGKKGQVKFSDDEIEIATSIVSGRAKRSDFPNLSDEVIKDVQRIADKYYDGKYTQNIGVELYKSGLERDSQSPRTPLRGSKSEEVKPADYEELRQERLAREKTIADQINLEKNSLYGFEEGKDPLKLGRVAKVLNEKWRHNGKLTPRKDILKEYVDNGYILNTSKTIVGKPNELGTVIGQKVNKTEAEFVQYLIDNKKQPPTETIKSKQPVETKVEKQPSINDAIERVKTFSEYEAQGYNLTHLRDLKRQLLENPEQAKIALEIYDFNKKYFPPELAKSLEKHPLTHISGSFYENYKSLEQFIQSQIEGSKGSIESAKKHIQSLGKSKGDAGLKKTYEGKIKSEQEYIEQIKRDYKDHTGKDYPDLQKTQEQPKIDLEKPTGNATIDRLIQEAKDALNNNPSFADPTVFIKSVQIGALHLKNGLTKFADWSSQMVKDFGEKIKPHLLKIWAEIKKFGEDLGKIAVDKIGEFIESKYNPARPLKMTEGRLSELQGKYSKQEPKPKAEANVPKNSEELVNKFRGLIERGGSEEQFKSVIKKETFRNPEDEARFIQLKKRMIEESEGGKKLSRDEMIEFENLKPAMDMELNKINALRGKPQVAKQNPITNATYQILFEKSRNAEIEAIALNKEISDLVLKARNSLGVFRLGRYDERVIDALGGKRNPSTLTNAEKTLYDRLIKLREETKPTMTKEFVLRDYDFPLLRRGFFEAWKFDGLGEALKEKWAKKDAREINSVLAEWQKSTRGDVFNPFALKRTGRTVPTMDLMKRLEPYIDIYTTKKQLDPILPTVNKLIKSLSSSGLENNAKWIKDYADEILGKNFDKGWSENNKRLLNGLMKYNAIRYLWYNLPGGLLNFGAGKWQAFTSPDVSVKDFVMGEARFFTPQGQKILANKGIVDAGHLEYMTSYKSAAKEILSPYILYKLGERSIQGAMYLGKLTKEEFRSGKIDPMRDRQLLEIKGSAQGFYHKGMRPDIVRTTIGRGAMQFRLWLPAVMESKVKKFSSTVNAVKSLLKKEKLNPEDVKQAQSLLKETTAVASAIYLFNSGAFNNEVKERLEGVLADMYSFGDPASISFMSKNLYPAIGTLGELAELVGLLISQAKYKTNAKYGQKGDYRWIGKGKQLLPAKRLTQQIMGWDKKKTPTSDIIQEPQILEPEIQ